MQAKPIPQPTPETKPFWDACDEGRLVYQQCAACGVVQTFPRALCHACGAESLHWKPSAGHGRVLSFTEVHRGPSIAFKSDQPYLLAIIEMDEGFRLMTNIRRCAPESVRIDMRVRVEFEPRGDDGRQMPIAVTADD
jgi:uncharacterized protein